MKKVLTLLVAGTLMASAMAPAFAGSPAPTVVETQPVYIQEDEDRGMGVLPFLLGGAAVVVGLALMGNNH